MTKHLAAVIVFILLGTAALAIAGGPVSDLADMPPVIRMENWEGDDQFFCPSCRKMHGEGSCVHASTITLLRWQGMDKAAEWWRENYNSGETKPGLLKKLEESGLDYAYTETGDVTFLEWCVRNRLGAGLFYKPSHAINLVDLRDDFAVLLDNNNTGKYEYVDRVTFERRWKTEFRGFAWTIVGNPAPPLPLPQQH